MDTPEPSPPPRAPADEDLPATARWDRRRALCTGPLSAVVGALMLTVAVQHFQASPAAKALLSSAASIGYLCTPLAVLAASRLRLRVSRAYGWALVLAGLALVAAGAVDALAAYLAGFVACLVLVNSATPLNIATWRQNAPDASRGRWYSRVIQAEVFAGLGATAFIWLAIGDQPDRYRPLLLVVAGLLLAAGWCAWRIPSRVLPEAGRNPLAALAWLWRDPAFGYVNLSWMVMGTANFMVLPLRVEYLAADAHGLGYTAGIVQLVVVGVPAVVRLGSTRLWGWLFDRWNFILLRMSINACFCAAILLFFTPSLPLQLLGGVCFGIAFGGGDIAWNLWVTKYAPPERTADYMAVHVFLTGLRGLIGPFLGFALLGALGIRPVAIGCAATILVASAMLLPEIRRMRPGPAAG